MPKRLQVKYCCFFDFLLFNTMLPTWTGRWPQLYLARLVTSVRTMHSHPYGQVELLYGKYSIIPTSPTGTERRCCSRRQQGRDLSLDRLWFRNASVMSCTPECGKTRLTVRAWQLCDIPSVHSSLEKLFRVAGRSSNSNLRYVHATLTLLVFGLMEYFHKFSR